LGPSSYFMKSPPRQWPDDEARRRTEIFINGEDDE
jgi:myo-inositol-1-phosphate synthase